MSGSQLKPAIVLATHTMGLGVIRSLGMMNVPIVAVCYDRMKDMGYASKYVTETIYAPHPEGEEDAFVDLLGRHAARLGGNLLIPTSDETVGAVSRHKQFLERHYIVACTGWDISEKFIVKKHTYAAADAAGVPAPKTLVPESTEDVEQYGRTIEFPCLVKPCESHRFFAHFGTKMVRVDNLDQMVSTYQQATDAGLEVMLQEIIPGDDTLVVNYNSYFWDDEPLVEFTAQQVRKAPPEFGAPRVVMSKEIPEVLEPGRKILRALGFYGYSCTEFKKDPRDGVYKLMEVNGRHNRSTLLAVRCGVNFPWLQYQHLVQGKLPSAARYRSGVYWIDIARDAVFGARYRKVEKYSLGEYARPYLNPHVFSVFDMKDLKPFFRECNDFIRRAAGAAAPSAKPQRVQASTMRG